MAENPDPGSVKEVWLKHLAQAKHHASNAERLRENLETQLKQWNAQNAVRTFSPLSVGAHAAPLQQGSGQGTDSSVADSDVQQKIQALQKNVQILEASTKQQKELVEAISTKFLELALFVDSFKAQKASLLLPELNPQLRKTDFTDSEEEGDPMERKGVTKGEDDEGNKLINEYCILSDLGRGAFGKVKLVVHNPTDKLFAIKIINTSILGKKHNSEELLLDLQREIAVMKRLRHQHIVTLHEVLEDLESGKIYLILDFVEKGAVRAVDAEGGLVGPKLDESTMREYLIQILDALKHLHRRRIIHRDIKPENLLLTESGEIRIADFGKAIKPSAEASTVVNSCQGTPAYMPPEAIRGDVEFDGTSQDVWALGVTVYTLVVGKLPFYRDSYPAMSQAIQMHQPEYPSNLSPEITDLMNKMMDKDPAARITVREICSHPFVLNLSLGEASDSQSPLGVHSPHAWDTMKIEDEITEQELRDAIKPGRGLVLVDKISLMVKIKQRVNRIRARIAKRHAERANEESNKTQPALP